MTPIAPKVKIYLAEDKFVTAEEFVSAKASKSKLEEKLVRKILAAAYSGEEFEMPEDSDKRTKQKIDELSKEFVPIIKRHKKFKAAADEAREKAKEEAKEAREREKAEAEKKVKEYTGSLGVAMANRDLIKQTLSIQQKMDETLTAFLPKSFKVDGNEIAIVGNANREDFAKAFAGFIRWAETANAVGDSAAKREAQLGLLAREKFGDEWVNFFKSDRQKDFARIKKYMSAFDEADLMDSQSDKKVKPCGRDLIMSMPLGNFRKIVENKFSSKEEDGEKWKEKGARVKLELANVVKSALEKAPDNNLTQMQVSKIVADFKEARGIKGKEHFRFLYILTDEDGNTSFFGSDTYEEQLLKTCIACIDRNLNVFMDDGDQGIRQIVPSKMSDEQKEAIQRMLGVELDEEPKKGKKNKKDKDEDEYGDGDGDENGDGEDDDGDDDEDGGDDEDGDGYDDEDVDDDEDEDVDGDDDEDGDDDDDE